MSRSSGRPPDKRGPTRRIPPIGASFISKNTHNLAWVITGVRTGRDIQPISDKPGEEEVLFPPGAKFMVDSVDTSKINLAGGDPLAGKLVIHLVEV